jgi:hypothetical protein
MIEGEIRIEADRGKHREPSACEQRIAEREHGVDWVGWRTARSLVEGKFWKVACYVAKHGGEEAKVPRCRFAFDSQQLRFCRRMCSAVGETRKRLQRSIALGFVSDFEITAQEDPTVLDLGRHQVARKSEAAPLIESGAILRDADRHILMAGRNCVAEHPATGRCVGDRNFLAEQCAKRGRTQRNGAMQHHFGHVADWNFRFLLLGLYNQHLA